MAAETNARPRGGGPNTVARVSTEGTTKPDENGDDKAGNGLDIKGGPEGDGATNGSTAHGSNHPQGPNPIASESMPNEHPPPLGRSQTAKSGSKIQTSLLQKQHSSSPGSLHTQPSNSQIDPISQHILKRTNTEKSIPSRLRPQGDAEAGPSEGGRPPSNEDFHPTARLDSHVTQKSSKDKKKGVSFLSRFIGGKKRDSISELKDDASEAGEHRATGMDAEVFAQPIGFIPRFPPPPKYIKVRSHHLKEKEFNRLFVAQELHGTSVPSGATADNPEPPEPAPDASEGKAVWVAEFSKDGRFLAVAGQDKLIRIWAVIATPEDRQAHEIEEEAQNDKPLVRLSAPVFKTQPIREFEGHTGSIVDISWSKNNFLLSTSMDKTVRLWHITRNECLCCFKHVDFVTSIEFHPRDDRFFLAGSLDAKLRLWSIPDKSVAYWATLPDMITAVAFTPDGKHSIAGCLSGLCTIFETDGLKIISQIHVRSARGRNAKGSKITGIDTMFQPPDQESGVVKLLVTSNDSRIRLYNFRDRTLEAKFRGNENSSSQIRASFSSDGHYIICGSEDRRVYIWPLSSHEKYADKRPVELFEPHSSIVTTAIMAPVKTKRLLGTTGDLMYDLCNPPPITLVSQTPSMTSKTENEKNESVPAAPRLSGLINQAKAEESPEYLAKADHADGNIIVTADYNGTIKVFRQDCGYHRRRHEAWDTNSTFSRKILGRASSISTRRSVTSIGKTPSERIISWRNSVIGARANSSVENLRFSQGVRTRSASPSRSLRKFNNGAPGSGPQQMSVQSQRGRTGTIPSDRSLPKLTVNHPFSGAVTSKAKIPETNNTQDNSNNKVQNGSAVADDKDPLLLQGDQSYMFWDKANFARQAANRRRSSLPDEERMMQEGHMSSDNDSFDESGDVEEALEEEEEEEELRCPHCQGTNFRATRLKHGDQRLICVQCGAPAM